MSVNNEEFLNQTVFMALNARPGTTDWMMAIAEAIANRLIYLIPNLSTVLDGESVFGIALLAMGLCVAWARIYLGVHFPLDMLGSPRSSICSSRQSGTAWVEERPGSLSRGTGE